VRHGVGDNVQNSATVQSHSINLTLNLPVLWILFVCFGDTFLGSRLYQGWQQHHKSSWILGKTEQRLKSYAMCASFLAFAKVWMRQMGHSVYKEPKCRAFWDSFHVVMYSCWYAGCIWLICPDRLNDFPEQRL